MALPFVKALVPEAASKRPASHGSASSDDVSEGASWRSMYGQAPAMSDDLRRIIELPRRPRPPDEEVQAWADFLRQELGTARGDCECVSRFRRRCCANLLPTQAWALKEASDCNGLLGPIGVGHGKTLLDLLTPMVVDAKRAVLLLPPALKRQLLEVDWHFYGQHWKLPNLAGVGVTKYVPGRPMLYVLSFSELSTASKTDVLESLKPDVVIIDEAHQVRNRTAARTKRLLRYLRAHEEVRVFCWSGTLTSKSIKDYAHLAAHSLKDGSPVPLHFPTVEEWASHLDPTPTRTPIGELRRLTDDVWSTKEGCAREGYRRRLIDTPGVVSSGDTASCQASLTISERKVTVPKVVADALEAFDGLAETGSWQRPDGEELVDALSAARCARELSCGFYYRWKFPRGEPVPVIKSWLEARKEWHKELREKLKTGRSHMDSPLLLVRAVLRWQRGYVFIERDDNGCELRRIEVPPRTRNGPLPTWDAETWGRWDAEKDLVRPETEPVWLSDWLVRDTLDWLREPGLAWYEFQAFSDKLTELAAASRQRISHAASGDDGNKLLLSLMGKESVLASIRAHGTGKNLQQFSRNLVVNVPSDGGTWEQLLGRTHRQGQLADVVTFETYRHTEALRAAVEKARNLALHIEGTFGAKQRLSSIAEWCFS